MHEARLQPAQAGLAAELSARAGDASPAAVHSSSHGAAIVLRPLALVAFVLALRGLLGVVWPLFPFPEAAPVVALLAVGFAFGALRRVRATLVVALGVLVAVAHLGGQLWTAAAGLLVAVPPACVGLAAGWAWASRRRQAPTDDEGPPVAADAYAEHSRDAEDGHPSLPPTVPAGLESPLGDPDHPAEEPPAAGSPPPAPGGPPEGVSEVEFPVVVRGYDRKAVDRYLAHVDRLVAHLRSTRSPRAAIEHELERVGEETAGILQRAHATADSITARSRAQADYRLQTAEREAASAVAAAESRLRELEADRNAIWQERERLIEDARRLADAILGLAEDAAERLTSKDLPGDMLASTGRRFGEGAPEPAPPPSGRPLTPTPGA